MVAALSSCAAKKVPEQTQEAAAAKAATNALYANNVSMSAGVNAAAGTNSTNFSWYDRDGKMVSVNSLKGKTVLINFWATWCGPCKEELPDIEAISKQFAPKGLVVIGVSEDRGPGVLKDVSAFVKGHGLTYQIVIDSSDIADAYGNINAIPTSFLVNKDGKIVKTWVGLRDKSYFEATVKKYID